MPFSAGLVSAQTATGQVRKGQGVSQFRWTDRHITRSEVQKNRGFTYIFGDNVTEKGMGGMAKQLRGEPNAVGIPTKWRPTMDWDAFFSDNPTDHRKVEHARDFMETAIQVAERRGLLIIVPSGIGQGLAQMPTRCPELYKWLCNRLERPELRM
jgi:hypothetical protein